MPPGFSVRFIGLQICYPVLREQKEEVFQMIMKLLRSLLSWNQVEILDAEYEPFRRELNLAGLREEDLRQMDPDDRVAVLEQAKLDPYDYIYLAC